MLHRKQGELQPMPKKNKLNARRRCASISLSLLHTQGVQTLTNQKMQNEPNYRTPGAPPTPISAKRTQFTPTPALPTIQICKTNPIPAYQASHHPLFLQNEPNLRTTNYQLRTIYAKRTQFTAQPPHYSPFTAHFTILQNEPNLSPHLQSTIYNIQSNGPIPAFSLRRGRYVVQ